MTEFEESEARSKKHLRRMVLAFSAILVVGFAAFILYQIWEFRQGERWVKELAHAIEMAAEADYELAMSDTYGGRTPQETLQMYIEAVEEGDHELASKYFIHAKQEKELKSFEKAKANQEIVATYVSRLRDSVDNEGFFSRDDEYFSFSGDLLITAKKYPNGLWKLIEI